MVIRKEQILQKALSLFNEQGYMEVGVREIARTLKISPGNLSYHFNKKEDLLIALLEQFSRENNMSYENYFNQLCNLENFLILMKRIFHTQYNFRGVYIGNQFVQAEIEKRRGFEYTAIADRRRDIFRKIFHDLHVAGDLTLHTGDIEFLVSYITLFGRFWISEATLFDKSPIKEKVIGHYLGLLSKQLSLFSTERGLLSIEQFLANDTEK